MSRVLAIIIAIFLVGLFVPAFIYDSLTWGDSPTIIAESWWAMARWSWGLFWRRPVDRPVVVSWKEFWSRWLAMLVISPFRGVYIILATPFYFILGAFRRVRLSFRRTPDADGSAVETQQPPPGGEGSEDGEFDGGKPVISPPTHEVLGDSGRPVPP